MALRKACRELVLDVIVQRALCTDGGEAAGHMQLIVDNATLRVLSSFFRTSDLLQGNGITSMELVERQREPLPALDALYLLRPDASNVGFILQDFKNPGAPQHRHVHLAFASPLGAELMAKLAESSQLAPRVKTLIEVPLSFLTLQDRGFHFDMTTALPRLFPVPDQALLQEVAKQLADVCRCLHVTEPSIRHAQSKLCKAVAEQVQSELAGAGKGQACDQHQVPCQLLVLDRSVDMAATLVHEYTYEAMVFDLLDGHCLDGDSGVVHVPSKADRARACREQLLSDADPLWEEMKHQHLEAVQHSVDLKVEEIKRRCAVRDASQTSTSDLLRMLRESPEHRDAIDRLDLHTFLIGKLHQRLQEERLTTGVGLLEQDIACGVDRAGKDVKATLLQTQLTKLFSELETTLTSESKLRMLMMYLACMENVQAAVREKLIEVARLTPEDEAVLMAMLKTRLMEVPDAQRHKMGTGTVHRVTKESAVRFKRNAQAQGRFELSRFEPRVKLLLEQLALHQLSEEDFPALQRTDAEPNAGLRASRAVGGSPAGVTGLPAKDEWSFSAWGGSSTRSGAGSGANEVVAKDVSQRVLVFILGGITLSELRAAAEVAESLGGGTEVILGGTSVLTPRRLMHLFRKQRSDEGIAGGRGQEDELDLT